MVEIENKIKDLLKQKELIPLEFLNQFFETRKQNILSLLLNFIFKNNLEIYYIDKDNFKDIIRNNIAKEYNNKSKLIVAIQKYTEYSHKYESYLLSFLKFYSNKLLDCAFGDINYIAFINNNVLGIDFLFNYQYSKECLTFIRQVSDLIYNDFSFLNKSVNLIYIYFQNIFRYSRRLMIYMFVDNIFRKEILNNLEKNIFYKRLSEVVNKDKDPKIFLKLIYKNETEIKELIVYNKMSGINSGAIIQTDKIKYFIKTFHNLFKKQTSYESLDLKIGFSSNPLTSEKELNELIINIFEPLEYFILEELDYGPKVEIIINPYVNEGLYIVTKDIEENGNKFYLFKDINDKMKNNIIKENDLINDKDLAISLNEIYIISILLDIKDLNIGNFGFLENGENIDEKNLKYEDIKIIDFIPSFYKNNKNFSSYNSLITRQNNGIDLNDKNIIGRIILSNDNDINNKNQILNKAFKKIKNKLKDRNLNDILEKCLTRLINILEVERGNNSDEIMLMNTNEFKKRKNYEFLGYQNIDSKIPYYYPNIKSDLESYINFIINNFNELEKNLIK